MYRHSCPKLLSERVSLEKGRGALKSAALLPTIHNTLWERFGAANEVSDSVIKAYLTLDRLDEGETPYSDSAADEVISSYRKSLEFADLTNADSIQSDSEDKAHTAGQDLNVVPEAVEPEPSSINAPKPPIVVNVGDFVQWESQGALQFERPKRVRWISDDGTHLAVDGSDTGIAVDQVSLEQAPLNANPPAVQAPPAEVSKPDMNVVSGQRKAVFPVSDGDVTFIFPDGLTIDGIEELEAYLAVFLKKEKRLAK